MTKQDNRPGLSTWTSAMHAFFTPILPESRTLLKDNWQSLTPALQTPHQMFGRQGNGCGATIGAMPRCDFACRGCYLGAEANTVPAQSVEEIKQQMRVLRRTLGPAGNLQLTDGEVTLRPVEQVIELLQYARSLDLIPMLMTHGDSFRRRPELLKRLVREGGLTELSIHIDTTQRGRVGPARYARTEAALNPLRAEFGAMLRAVRATTGIQVRAATTMTITPDNIGGVADVVRWLRQHPDDFFMISFQPIAQVGRTEDGLGDSVDVEHLWREIARGLYGSDDAASVGRLLDGQKWLGHPDCNRFVHGVFAEPGQVSTEGSVFHPVRQQSDAVDVRVVDSFLAQFGGLSFRRDQPLVAFARALGVAAQAPLYMARTVLPYAWHWLKRIDARSPWRALRDVMLGRRRTHGFLFVSHHFMSRQQLETPLGQERVAHCVFQVPVNGTLVSMCEVNATGIREAYYAQITSSRRGEHSLVS